jgi:hypothetical protein
MKKLFIKLSILVFCIVAVLLGVQIAYNKIYKLPFQWPENVLPNPKITDKYQIVKVGNSHSLDGITFKGYKMKSLNLASAAQKFEFDLAVLKQYSKQIDKHAVILIDASQISFSHNTDDSQTGFQAIYYRRVSPFFIPRLNISDYIESEFLPFTRVGYFWRKKYAQEITDRISAEEKWIEPTPTLKPTLQPNPTPIPSAKPTSLQHSLPPPTQTLPLSATLSAEEYFFNVEAIRNELASPSAKFADHYMDNMDFTFNKWYHTDEFNPKFFAQNRKNLENLIAYCLQQNWKPVVITVPISQRLKDGLLDDYMQTYLYDNVQKTHLQGVEYIDFGNDTRITKNTSMFSNADHLGHKGAAIFSYELLQKLIEKGYLPKEADEYDYRPLESSK